MDADAKDIKKDERCIVFHGFEHQEIITLMKAVKEVAQKPENVAFAMTTPNNLSWPVEELIKDLREHHDLTLKQKAAMAEQRLNQNNPDKETV